MPSPVRGRRLKRSELFSRARRAAVIRADAAPRDIAAIFALLGPAFQMPGELWRRYLALVLDRLRAVDRPELPAAPPPLAALDAILKAGKRRGGRLPGDVGGSG